MHEHDRGLSFDLSTLMTRRRALQLAAVGGLAVLAGCGSSREASDGAATTAATGGGGAATSSADGATAAIAKETAGPFPADGLYGISVLDDSGIARADITSSFGAASATAEGVPLSIRLTIIDVAGGGAPVEGAAVYLWQCDREGLYSVYDLPDENYLRGVQASDADGRLAFTSIWPGAYSERWPHIHLEVYESLEAAGSTGAKLVTSQIALPEDACAQVYATGGYERSAENLARTSLTTDSVFRDGYSTQLGTAGGSPTGGMTLALNVGV